MYSNDEDGGPKVRYEVREISMESQVVLGLFLMFAFAGLVWFLFAGGRI